MKNLTILITSAVIPNDPTSVKLNSFEDRKFYTLESIKRWVKLIPNVRLVICDGSNYNFKEDLIANHINIENIECLAFQNDNKAVSVFGKGYGESKIINYSLQYSKLLCEVDYFAKCTGKLFVENFFKVLPKDGDYDYCFMPNFEWQTNPFNLKLNDIDTRFFLVKKRFYMDNFTNIYDNNLPNQSIETLFLEKLIHLELEHFLFSRKPIISGMSGGSGKFYNTKFYRILKDRLKYFFYKKSGFYRNFFI